MNTAIGMIIKYNRVKNNISQAELCKDICVPSYLSKIENAEINAHADIYKKVLNKLNISYSQIIEKEQSQSKVRNIIDLITSLKSKEAKQLYSELDSSYEKSPYIFEYLAMKYYYSDDEHAEIKSLLLESIAHLDDKTTFSILMLLYLRKKDEPALLNRAIKIYPCGYGYFMKGLSLYREKTFSEAYKYFQMAEAEYLKSGQLFGIIHSKRHQAVMLAFLPDKNKSLTIFESVKNLMEDSKNPAFDGVIQGCNYNINFLKYEMGMEHDLENVCLQLIESRLFNNSIPYHVLHKVYNATDTQKAKKCLLDGMERHNDPKSYDYLQLEADMYKLDNPDYMKSSVYYDKLKVLRKSLGPNGNFGIRYSIEKDMIDYLKANRRYKEALEITEELGSFDFS